MNERNEKTATLVCTIDGMPVEIGAPVVVDLASFDFDVITDCFEYASKQITVALKGVGEGLHKIFTDTFNSILTAIGGRVRPKWLHFYRHSKKARIRRKYFKKLIRAAKGVLGW